MVGSFTPNGYKVHKRKHHREQTVGRHREQAVGSPTTGVLPDPATTPRPITQAKPNDEPGLITTTTPTLPVQSRVEAENTASTTAKDDDDNPNAAAITATWNGSESRLEHGPSPDINISVPGE